MGGRAERARQKEREGEPGGRPPFSALRGYAEGRSAAGAAGARARRGARWQRRQVTSAPRRRGGARGRAGLSGGLLHVLKARAPVRARAAAEAAAAAAAGALAIPGRGYRLVGGARGVPGAAGDARVTAGDDG